LQRFVWKKNQVQQFCLPANEFLKFNLKTEVMQFKRILIAVDNSAFSLRAAKAGFSLAHQLGSEVGLVFVIDKSREIVSGDLGITFEQSATALLRQAEETIDQLIRMYDGVSRVFRFTPEGFPKTEIISIANEWEADLIVMGTHGRSGLSHILLGSVAESVVKHAGIPVMVVPNK
jgi:nucleotide-binding universal stress UspA family protein